MSDPHILRARILTVFGVTAILSGHGIALGDCAVSDSEIVCIGAPDDDVCLPQNEVQAELEEHLSLDCPVVDIEEGVFEDNRCCYEVKVLCPSDSGLYTNDCGCYGRPFVVEGQVIQATGDYRNGWSRDVRPDLEGLSASQRRLLAEKWTEDALAEHSSVAGFNRFALDLMAHGAPADLVLRAQVAAGQEIEHARLCFGLASAYAGRSLGPSGLPIAQAPVARDLVELAVWTATEGAIGETLAAWLATAARDRATDSAVRAVLDRIVEDETEHAQLAWATLKWAVEVGGEDVRAALNRVMRTWAGRVSGDAVGLHAHGLLTPTERAQALKVGWNEVVRPAFDALLGTELKRSARSTPLR